MRTFSLQTEPARRRISLTPLIDVIFILLMFFMLSSSLNQFQQMDLNSASEGVGSEQAQVLLTLISDTELRLNTTIISLSELETALGNLPASVQNNKKIIVKANDDANVGVLVNVMGVLRRTDWLPNLVHNSRGEQ